MFRFGVHTMIWSERFAEKDLSLIEKAKSLGFEVLNISVRPETFPTELVKQKAKEVGIELVTTTSLSVCGQRKWANVGL